MTLTPTNLPLDNLPEPIRRFSENAPLYDSSCSTTARVTYIDRDGGYFLKQSAPGTLRDEAELTAFFHGAGLAPELLHYISDSRDWLLTRKVSGEDGISSKHLENPTKLCDIFAERLRMLHSVNIAGCPVPNHTERYLARVRRGIAEDNYDPALFPDNWGFETPDAAADTVRRSAGLFEQNTLLHGDYCLPNIILRDWAFSGFIDLGGGVGDRHIDIFWGIWTLFFNTKSDRYRERFIDAYGRDMVDEERLRAVAACEVFL
jgi:kanamycin kinase